MDQKGPNHRGGVLVKKKWRRISYVPAAQGVTARRIIFLSQTPDLIEGRASGDCTPWVAAQAGSSAASPRREGITAAHPAGGRLAVRKGRVKMRGVCSEKALPPDFIPLNHKDLRSPFSFFAEQLALVQREGYGSGQWLVTSGQQGAAAWLTRPSQKEGGRLQEKWNPDS